MSSAGRYMVYIYSGLGTSPQSLQMLTKALTSTLAGTTYCVKQIGPEEIKAGDWQDHAALMTIGGGFDKGVIQALGLKGLSLVKDYVHQGGAYLGLCSGGYLACDSIQFDQGGPLQVCGERHLKFFPGCCIGPVFSGFKYASEAGAYATPVTWTLLQEHSLSQSMDMNCYFNGGGFFQPPGDTSETSLPYPPDGATGVADSHLASKKDDVSFSVLATYKDTPGEKAAVVKCNVGHGTAILTGIHVEYLHEDLDREDEFLQEREVVEKLKASEPQRKTYFKEILKVLGLKL